MTFYFQIGLLNILLAFLASGNAGQLDLFRSNLWAKYDTTSTPSLRVASGEFGLLSCVRKCYDQFADSPPCRGLDYKKNEKICYLLIGNDPFAFPQTQDNNNYTQYRIHRLDYRPPFVKNAKNIDTCRITNFVGYRLIGDPVEHQTKTVENDVVCAQQCIANATCAYFNYIASTKTCNMFVYGDLLLHFVQGDNSVIGFIEGCGPAIPDDWNCGFKPVLNTASTGGSLLQNATDLESCWGECEKRRGRCFGFDLRASSECYILDNTEYNLTMPSAGDDHYEFMCECTQDTAAAVAAAAQPVPDTNHTTSSRGACIQFEQKWKERLPFPSPKYEIIHDISAEVCLVRAMENGALGIAFDNNAPRPLQADGFRCVIYNSLGGMYVTNLAKTAQWNKMSATCPSGATSQTDSRVCGILKWTSNAKASNWWSYSYLLKTTEAICLENCIMDGNCFGVDWNMKSGRCNYLSHVTAGWFLTAASTNPRYYLDRYSCQ